MVGPRRTDPCSARLAPVAWVQECCPCPSPEGAILGEARASISATPHTHIQGFELAYPSICPI